MKQSTKDRLNYYRRQASNLIYVLGFVLGVVGSIQVYQGQFDSPVREASAVLYSIIKLFMFSPTIDITKPAPLTYDLARWIAPLGTVLGLFSVFGRLYTAIKLKLHHLGQNPMVVMGANDKSIVFMKNVLRDRPNQRIVCVMAEGEGMLDPQPLEELGIRVCTLDYTRRESFANRKTVSEYRIDHVALLVCFEKESRNYGYLSLLNDLVGRKNQPPVAAYVNTESSRLREIVQHRMDQLAHLNFHYFNTHDLVASELMSDPAFSIHRTPAFETSWHELHVERMEDISEQLGTVHLLLVGFSDMGQHVLTQASNQATMSATKNLRVTIVDREIRSIFEVYEAEYDQHGKAFDVQLLELDIHSKSMRQHLDALQEMTPITAVIYALTDTRQSLLNLDRLGSRFKTIPMAVYCERATEIRPFIDAMQAKYDRLVFYGQLEDALTEDVIINESRLRKAKRFNEYYNRVCAELMGWKPNETSVEDQWQSLSIVKKESSLCQAMHQNVKRDILAKLCELPGYPADVDTLIEQWRQKLEGKSIAEQVNIIEADVGMNFMTALEHRRWNNFHYMRGFQFAAVKDERKKTHDCLIDDWSEFLGAQRDKAIYDFLSTLSLQEDAPPGSS